jgi:hypothetical protein
MPVTAAITINVSPATLASRIAEAGYPLNDPDAVAVTTVPAPGGRGTELRVIWQTEELTGIGRAVARFTGDDPQVRLDDVLRRLKQLIETGEVLRSDGSPSGTDGRDQRHQRPAQPAGNTDTPAAATATLAATSDNEL